MPDERIVTLSQADGAFAGLVSSSSSVTRSTLDSILPKGDSSLPSTSVAQLVKQRADGSWPNPVRDSDVSGRIYMGVSADGRAPAAGDGLMVGDAWWSITGVRIATAVPSAASATWAVVGMSGGTDPGTGGGGDPTTPPPATGDTSTPSATSRPFALLATTGVWRSTGGTTIVQALSDQAASGVTAEPTAAGGGVSLTIDMSNFSHTVTNSIVVTLWGAASTTPGDVTATIGHGTTLYGPAKTLQVGATPGTLTFTWPGADLLSLPTSTWRDVEITVSRPTGGFSALADITLQSMPPVVSPGPVDTGDPLSLTWASGSVWTSQVATAPAAKASAAIAAYVRAQASTLRLDCLPGGDAPPVWMVPATAQRVNVTPPATSPRGAVTLMHTTDGKGALDAVPLPAAATTPGNLFKTAVVACVETQQVWELLGLTKTGTTWSAEWGGRIDGTTKNGGVFPAGTGYTGSGLAHVAASVKVTEAKAAAGGQVDAIAHAIGINLAYGAASTKFCWPATRSDGASSDAGAPQMGQRLRLKSTFDVAAATGLTPIGKAIAKAMQRYGAVIMGGAEKPSILCESGTAEQTRTGVDPWGSILAGKTVDTALAGIPLDQLDAVSPGWGGPNWVAETDPVIVTPPTTPPTTPPATGSAAMRILGPTRSGLPWHSGVKADGPYQTSMVEKFGQWRGRPVDGGLTYPAYDNGGRATRNDIIGSGWCATLYNGFPGRLYYGMAPFSHGEFRSSMNWDARLWARLANGEMDDIIDGQAKFLADNGRGNSIIRIAWEWNGDWYTWRAGLAGVNHFKNGFRRIVQRFRAKSPNFKFCFEINNATTLYGDGAGLGALTKAYPGDDVVDLVGLDIYNFGGEGSPDGAFWRYLRQTTQNGGQGPRLDDVADFARAHGKGMAIMEWGIHGTSGYGDNPSFIQGMWDWLVKNKDVVACESYFNEYEPYIKCSLYNSQTGAIQNPKSAAKYKELWGRGV